MANPIKASDLYSDSGDLQKLIAELKEVQRQMESLKKTAAQLESQNSKLTSSTALQRESIEGTAAQADEVKKRYDKYADSLGDTAVKIAALKNAQIKINQINKAEAKILTEKEGSYNRLSAQYTLNKLRLNQLSAEERKNTKSGQDLVKTTNDIYQEMKRLQEETGKHVLSVGDYTKGIREASKEQKKLSAELNETKKLQAEAAKGSKQSEAALKQYNEEVKSLTKQIDNLGTVTGKTSEDFEEGFIDSLSSMEGAAGQAGQGIKGLGQTFKALLANPVVLVIAAIVAGLSLLFSAFQKSAKGSELLSKGAALLDGAMSLVVGLVDTLIIGFENLFNDPIGSIKEFGQAIIDNVLNRFKAIPKLLDAAGRAIKNLLTGNFEEAKEAAKDFGSASVQAFSGLDGAEQKAVVAGLEDLKNKIEDTTAAFLKLDAAKLSARRANRSLARSIEAIITAEELAKSIADDSTKSFEVREKAREEAAKKLEARSKKEIQIARNNLSVINQELSQRQANGEKVEDLLDSQVEAYKALSGAEREFTLSVRDNEKTRDELKQDRLEKDLDILIDGFDNQKTINERLLNDERLTLDQRKDLLKETSQLSDQTFAKQIQTVQEFTGIAIDENDLINESNAVTLNEKIRGLGLSEIIEGRLLEVIRERRIANQDLNEAEVSLAEKTRSEGLKTLEVAQSVAKSDFDLTKATEEQKVQFAIDQKQKELDAIRALNESQSALLPKIDTSELEAEIRTLFDGLSEGRRKTALEIFDEQAALAESEFNLLESTEAEKTTFRLEAEKERLQKILDLNEKFGSDLSSVQLQIFKNQIAAINNELGKIGADGGITDIYDLFGFDLDDPEKEAITKSVTFVKDQLTGLADKRAEVAAQNVQQANADISEAQRSLDVEIQNRNAGFANEVSTAKARLAEARKNQVIALKEQEKAQQAQARIQTLEQGVNLVTASTKIWAEVSPFLAIPLIAVMFGSFVAAKIRAASLTKKKFEKGGLEVIGGGSHASGNDTPLGFQSGGADAYGEAGEAHAIIPKGSTRKYKKILPDIVNSLRKGNFESKFQRMNAGSASSDSVFNLMAGSASSDMGKVEEELATIRKQGERSFSFDSDGNVKSERYKNLVRIYV